MSRWWRQGAGNAERLALLDAVFERVPVGLALLEHGALSRVNAAFVELLGSPPAEVRGRRLSELVAQAPEVSDLPETGTAHFEVELPRRDGQVSLVSLSVTALEGTFTHAVSAIDRTRDRLTERELRAQREFLRTVIDTVPGFVFVKDWDSRFLLANRALAEAYGTTPEVLTGKFDIDFNPNPEETEHFIEDDREVITTRKPKLIMSEKITRSNGEVQWLTTIKVPVVDGAGNCSGVLGVATDITDLKCAEEAQQRLQERMLEAQKLESLGVLAGGIAHDFNNLMLAVLGSAEAELIQVPEGTPLSASLLRIRTAAVRAAELTNQLLAYSGKGRFVVETVDLRELVRDMAELLDVTTGHRVVLHYEFGDVPGVTADVAQLRQVVLNLITNAVDAIGDASGAVTLETGTRRFEADELVTPDGALPAGDYVFLRVADTGIGMDEVTQSKMFEPFFTTKFTGRGLGLAAVQGIVRGHRGAIEVASERGKGSVFTVYLPASNEAPRAPSRRAPATTPQPEKVTRTVLVIDDEALICFTTKQLLELSGYEALTASEAASALKTFECHPGIDVVLLDLTMPGMSADELLLELRRRRADVRVVIMSGYDEQEIERRLGRLALAAFLQKPFTIDQLNETLTRVLST